MDTNWTRVAEVRCLCGRPSAVITSNGRELRRERPAPPERPAGLADEAPVMFAPRQRVEWCTDAGHRWQLRPQDRRRALQDGRQPPPRWKPRSVRGIPLQ